MTPEADPSGDAMQDAATETTESQTLTQSQADAEAARQALLEAAASHERRTLVSIRNLKTYYPIRAGILRRVVGNVRAVDDVSFDIRRGEVFGLVGESGCGKTTLGRTLLRLEQPTAGAAEFDGVDLLKLHGNSLKAMRRRMQVIFQDPVGSLNPRMPISDIIGEGLLAQSTPENGWHDRKIRDKRVGDYLEEVGLRREYTRRYPHEFSGGQRQRIGIARALALRPKLVIADEPVSALDVSIQSQVLNLLVDLKHEFGLTYVFVAHNLAVVAYISDRIAVMYLGKVVELAGTDELYHEPLHPYTSVLLSAIPAPDPDQRMQRVPIQGDVPSPFNPPSGCHFRTRCPLARAKGTIEGICAELEPPLKEYRPGHLAACHFAGEKAPVQ